MPESVYDVILLIGSSKESWEMAAANAAEQGSKSLRNLRAAEKLSPVSRGPCHLPA